MKKPDEVALWAAFGEGTPHRFPRDAGIALGIPSGRVEFLCEKWSRQGVYDYGVAASLGWKEPVSHLEPVVIPPTPDGQNVALGHSDPELGYD